MKEQRGRCKTCGTSEWQWPNEGEDSDIVADVYVCYGCERIEWEQQARKNDDPHPGLKMGFFAKE